jgi:hypothetical protein
VGECLCWVHSSVCNCVSCLAARSPSSLRASRARALTSSVEVCWSVFVLYEHARTKPKQNKTKQSIEIDSIPIGIVAVNLFLLSFFYRLASQGSE